MMPKATMGISNQKDLFHGSLGRRSSATGTVAANTEASCRAAWTRALASYFANPSTVMNRSLVCARASNSLATALEDLHLKKLARKAAPIGSAMPRTAQTVGLGKTRDDHTACREKPKPHQ